MKTILVPVDFSDVTAKVVGTAAAIAGAFGSRVILVHVTEPEPQFVGYDPGPLGVRVAVAGDVQAEKRLMELKDKFGGTELQTVSLEGSIPDEILRLARENAVTLIVMGSHGHGALYHLLAGSVATAVLKAASCPVLIVPRERTKK